MPWQVEYTETFETWWRHLDEDVQVKVAASIGLLEEIGPQLGRPHADTLYDSKMNNLKELRVQCDGEPYRILFAFDPRRVGVLLCAGSKRGNDRWYDEFIPLAEKLYQDHLTSLEGRN